MSSRHADRGSRGRVGAQLNARPPALVADGKHLLTDVVTSAALYGRAAIPAEWLDQLAWRDRIEALALQLSLIRS